MTQSRRKLREFYCSEYKWKDGSVTYTHISSKREQDFLVREVSPELDKAIEGLVKALKDISGDLNEDPESIALDSAPSEALKHSIQVARYALEELERVNG